MLASLGGCDLYVPLCFISEVLDCSCKFQLEWVVVVS